VSAVDFSPAMTERLRARSAAERWQGVTAVVGDGMALPFGNNLFDAAFSMFGLVFFPDRARGFLEMKRVLKPGCPAVISSWVPISQVPIFASTMSILSELLGSGLQSTTMTALITSGRTP